MRGNRRECARAVSILPFTGSGCVLGARSVASVWFGCFSAEKAAGCTLTLEAAEGDGRGKERGNMEQAEDPSGRGGGSGGGASRGWFCLNSISLMALFMHHLHEETEQGRRGEEEEMGAGPGGWKTWK